MHADVDIHGFPKLPEEHIADRQPWTKLSDINAAKDPSDVENEGVPLDLVEWPWSRRTTPVGAGSIIEQG